MTADLFAGDMAAEPIGDGATLLRGFALAESEGLLAAVAAIAGQAPFRRMTTPGGRRMSAAITNCGHLGWTSGAGGYRYRATDPDTGRPWPALPAVIAALARRAAATAGFDRFAPDACLVNNYAPGARMGLHQDRDEADLTHPIVSISLGLPAIFLWGGPRRTDPVRRFRLDHGDVLVFGGASRLFHHGVGPPIAEPASGLATRCNITVRRAGSGERGGPNRWSIGAAS